MAVIKRGILGGVQNKIGNVVGSSWKGIATLRSLPLSVANPRTAAQTAQRSKFGETAKIASSLLATIVKPLWDRFAQQESGYNAFIRANMPAFIDPTTPIIQDIVISKGSLAKSLIDSAALGVGDLGLTVNWETNPQGDANPTDLAFIAVIGVEDGIPVAFGFETGVARSVGTATVMANFSGLDGDIGVYLAFKKTDGTKVSDSAFSLAS